MSKATPWVQFFAWPSYGGQSKRAQQINAVRGITQGAHAYKDWTILRDVFECCARCGSSEWHLERDHIMPIAAGGCDCIANIQPLCARCNMGGKYKDAREAGAWIDYRGACMPNWVLAHEMRMLEQRRDVFMGITFAEVAAAKARVDAR